MKSSEVGEYHWEREGEIIRCPWHGWKFDITNGESVLKPLEVKTATFDVGTESRPTAQETEDSERTATDTEVESYEVGVEEEMVVVYLD